MPIDKNQKPDGSPKPDTFEKSQQPGQLNENKLPDFEFTPPPPSPKTEEQNPPKNDR